MGVVLLARQRSLQRDVALKRVRHPTSNQAEALLREVAFTGYLEHPNIVPVHALGRDANGSPVLVMKRIEGTTLATLLHDPSHSAWSRAGDDRLGFVLRAFRGVCDALSYAHARGVLHRDVKPENVMLGAFGEVYLLDWGVAVRFSDRLSDEAIVGTPVYMAPEMLRPGTEGLDERTDVYLVGAMLHEYLVGAPPHHGRNMHEVLVSVARSLPRAYPESVPPELADIARRAMHVDRGERFSSADALGQALALFERHRAAAELANAAEKRLVELEAAIARGDGLSAIEPLFHECRFGLDQSLRAWPENARARTALRRTLIAMTEHQLRKRNHASASALLAAIDSPPAHLASGLADLERQLAGEAEERARLRRLEHEMDPSVAEPARRRATRTMAVLVVLIATFLVVGYLSGKIRPSSGGMLLLMAPGLAIAATFTWRFRHALFENRINRQMSLTIAVAVIAVTTNRLLGFLHGRTFPDVASGDCLIVAAIAAISSLSLRRVYLVPAASFFVASLLCPRLGGLAFVPVLVAAVLSVAAVVRSPERLRRPLLDD